jgi:phospholipid/cholesterol/gamma-HCH transport system substrate-binding protein
MMTKAGTIRIGLFTVGIAGLLALVLVIFAGLRFWERRDAYHVTFEGSVMGLATGAQVFLNGVRVGAVDEIRIAPEDLGKVDVTIKIAAGTPVHEDTRALLQLAGITGLKVIDLRGGTLSSPRLAPGDQIAQGAALLDKLERQAQGLVDQSSQLMARANQVVANLVAITDPETFAAVPEILAQARLASANLAQASAGLGAMIAENDTTLRQTIVAIGASASTARALMDGQLSVLLRSAGEAATELKGVVHTNAAVVAAAVTDLRQASRSFKELARELRQRPSRLFFGGAQRDRSLP